MTIRKWRYTHKKHLDSFSIRHNREYLFSFFNSAEELLSAPFDYDILFLDIMLEKVLMESKSAKH